MDELSEREREVLTLLCDGMRNREIAAELFIGQETVKSHLKAIFRKLDVGSRCEAIAVAIRSQPIQV